MSKPATFQQAVQLALLTIEGSIQNLKRARDRDQDWVDGDVAIDFAVELVERQVHALQGMNFAGMDDFGAYWWEVASPLQLALRCFGRPDSIFGGVLAALVREFEVLPALLYAAEGAPGER